MQLPAQLMTYTAESRPHFTPNTGLLYSDQNPKVLILYGMEF
jgi:hypothetical protein